jgi:D-alanyl-D-alanine carboxypeptidase
MIYYVLGILAVIVVQLISFLKCYESGDRINWLHISISTIFSLYLVWLIEHFHNNVVENGTGLIKIVLLYIPIGVFMPFIYRRFKYFVMEVLLGCVINGLLSILQLINCGRINPLNILFSLFGILLGFVLSVIISKIAPNLRGKIIIKKKKRNNKYFSFEAEIVILAIFAMFFAIEGIEVVSGKNFEEKLKGTAVYEPENEYEGIYYADEDKYERYDAYKKLHPDMELEEVVWRVDANLDKEFYDEEYTTIADEKNSSPLLINKFNRVSEDYEPKSLVTIEGNYVSTPATAEAYHDMLAEMEENNLKVYIVSSYRDIKYQTTLYNNYMKNDSKENVDTYSARPGYSEHHTGRALDISQVQNNLDVFEGSEEAKWVYENCYRYGFIVRYKAEQMDVTGYIFEPWHIVYVGKEIAGIMHDENIETLEEYVVKYVDHQK